MGGMMPLRDERKPVDRRAARGWLAVSFVLLAVVFLGPLIVPFIVPVELRIGTQWLRVEAGGIPAVQQSWIDPGPGYTEAIGQPTLVMSVYSPNPTVPVFQTKKNYRWWWYRLGDVMYSVEVF